MSIRRYLHDLAVRFVVLGWIFARKPSKTAPKGHNFQPHPPALVDLDHRWLYLAAGAGLTAIWLCFRFAGPSQDPSTAPPPKS